MERHYELYKHGAYVGDFTLCQLMKKLLVGKAEIIDAVESQSHIGGYTIQPEAKTGVRAYNYTTELLEEWDRVRLAINPRARKAVS